MGLRLRLIGPIMCVCATVHFMPAQAAMPVVRQIVPRAERPTAVAVAPSGNQLALADEAGLVIFSLRASGSIAEYPAVGSLLLPGIRRLAFTPSGQYLFMAADNGLLHRLERETWTRQTYDLHRPGLFPDDMYLVENPPLLFITYSGSPSVTVVNYRTPSASPDMLTPTGLGALVTGRDVVARADGGMVFWNVGPGGAVLDDHLLYAAPYKTPGTAWSYQFTCAYIQLAIGPDPSHVLAAAEEDGELRIFNQDRAEGAIIGCHLPNFRPIDLAFSNDGYYAVLISAQDKALQVVSGHDLRGRLDPAAHVIPAEVRTARITLPHKPQRVALHPTLPMAYVTSWDDRKLMRISLAIPGITHP